MKMRSRTADWFECKIKYEKMQEDVPYFSAYVIGAQSATANRLTGVEQGVYGFFNNIQNWEIVQ